MSWQYAGGETRKSLHCRDCLTKRRPLKWCSVWSEWLCPGCVEKRITAEIGVVLQ